MDSSTSIGWFPVLESCPRCHGDSCLSPFTVDSDVYYSCSACQYFAGVDDSTDQYALAELVGSCGRECREGDASDRKVRTRIAVCTFCGNDNDDLFEIAGVDQTIGIVFVNCYLCDKQVTINTNALECDDNTIVESMKKDVVDTGSCLCSVDDDVSSLWQDVDVGNYNYVTNTYSRVGLRSNILPEDDSIVREWKLLGVGNGIGTSPEATGYEKSLRSEYFGAVPPARGIDRNVQSDVDLFSPQFKCDICMHRSSVQFRHACTTSRSRSSVSSDALRGTEGNVVKCDLEESNYECRKTPRGRQRSDRNAVDDNSRYIGQDRIRDLRHIAGGDHVSWQRWYAVWHHAIVVESLPDFGQLTVIHNSGSVKPLDGRLASVRLETIDVNPDNDDLYRYDYSASGLHCFMPDVVVQRASCRIGETYNPFVFNCEHFARWCKTGSQSSEQVKKLVDRVVNVGRLGTYQLGQQALAGFRRVGGRVGSVPVINAVAVNVLLEAGMVGREAVDDYLKYKSGAISDNAFRQRLAKKGCESAGGIVGSMAGGTIGSLLIPVPFVGSLVGSTLGNLVARWCGAVIGKQLVKS